MSAPEHRVKMPDGKYVRSTSVKRYLVAVLIPGTDNWRISYRSDDESKALALWRREARTCEAANLIDLTTNTVIR